MVLDSDLYAISHFVLAGDNESVNILDISDTGDYPWILYIVTSTYDSRLVDGWRSEYQNVPSDLLTYLINNHETRFDLLGNYTDTPTFKMPTSAGPKSGVAKYVEEKMAYAITDFLELNKRDTLLLTPFMGVGTKIPLRLGARQIAALISVCSSPAATHGVLVGDSTAARSLLGEGLQGVRSVLFSYLDVVPGDQSVTPDISVPLIYSEYTTAPSLLSICEAQLLGDDNSHGFYMLLSVFRLANLLYSILELDHGYLGLEVIGKLCNNYPRDWCVTTGSTTTRVPYRYPALVSLLAASSRRVSYDYETECADLNSLVSKRGPNTIINKIVSLKSTKREVLPLFQYLPKLCKSFFIQLYRHTCKDLIKLPSRTEFPRRSEASKAFVTTFNEYQSNSSLSAYLELAELLLQSSLLQNKGRLRDIVRLFPHSAYEIVLDPERVTTIPVKGSVYGDGEYVNQLWGWDTYLSSHKKYVHIEVKLETGEVVNLGELLKQSTLEILKRVDDLCDTEWVYSLINSDGVEAMTNYHGFYSTDITESNLKHSLITKVKFAKDPLDLLRLSDVVNYYVNLTPIGTGKVIDVAAKFLRAKQIETMATGGEVGSTASEYHKHIAHMAVVQYLQEVLNSSRV